MGKIINFPSPSEVKLRKAILKYKKELCSCCRTTRAIMITRGKLCCGIKRFFLFGKNVCPVDDAHIHVKCQNCGNEWTEE